MAPWTEERKRKQAEAIRRWKPWEKSTGPRSEAGKTRSKMNAYKGVAKREAKILLQMNRDFLKQYDAYLAADWMPTQRLRELLRPQPDQGADENS